MPEIHVAPHPLLDAAFVALDWSSLPPGAPEQLTPRLPQVAAPPALGAPTPERKAQVRDLLRHGGFKPNGRNKPCNEYIAKVVAQGRFPRISPIVDWTNAAVWHSFLPVSTVDLDRTEGPLRIGLADPGDRYVFNASGQELDLSGLLCLFDAEGPCANAVKDSQRTKTHDGTTRTLTVVWGTTAWAGRAAATSDWLQATATALGVQG